MWRRRRNNNLESIIYIFVIIFAIGIIGTIIEYIIPIIITCSIIGLSGIALFILKRYAYPKLKQKFAKPKNENDNATSIEYEIRYKMSDDLEGINLNYKKKPLLTDNEYNFYRYLAPIAHKYGFCILSKVRIADLVEPTASINKERSEYFHHFGKIKSKHIDFALCDPKNLNVKLLIELDDKSHKTAHGKERDQLVEEVYADAGHRLIRVYTPTLLEEKICRALDITEEYIIKKTS